jgi:hypothetical protein
MGSLFSLRKFILPRESKINLVIIVKLQELFKLSLAGFGISCNSEELGHKIYNATRTV